MPPPSPDTVAAQVWTALRDHLFAMASTAIAGMNARKTEEEIAVRHPRETTDLFGHREAETALL